MTAETLRTMSKKEVMAFIRERLSFKQQFPEIFEHIYVSDEDEEKVKEQNRDVPTGAFKNVLEQYEKNKPDNSKGIKDYQGLDKEHLRFSMSGYDYLDTGSCTLHNMSILNKFADLGIYDYSWFLFLDFYKGSATIYLKYYDDDEYHEEFDDLGGLTTTQIIYRVFELTIFSGRRMRRRD